MHAPRLPSPSHAGEPSCIHEDVVEEPEGARQLQPSLGPGASLLEMEISILMEL